MTAKKHSTTFEALHDYGIDVENRAVYLFGELTEEKVEQALKNLILLQRREPTQDILLLMNSEGGNVNDSFALYDFIREHSDTVTIFVSGACMSMAVAILQAAHTRSASINTRFMVHQGTTNVEEANTHDLKAETIETLKTSEIYEKILLDRIREKHPKFPAKKLRAMLDKTTYFSSQAALDLGLIDEVT